MMLTQQGCQIRRQNLWEQVPGRYEWLLIGDPRHIEYLCNFRVNPLSFSADQRALLLLSRESGSVLLADNFTRRSASADVFANREIVIPWYTHRRSVTNRDHALVAALHEVESLWDAAPGLVESEGVTQLIAATVGDSGDPVFSDHADAPLTLGEVIRRLRRSKLADEIDVLKACMQACDAGHALAREIVRPGVSEFEVYLEVQRAAQQAAGVPCLVYGDFRATSAERPKAGGLPTRCRLQPGDLFILDYSVVIHGYRSDFTNTIAVGDPSDDQLRQFEACRDALVAAESLLRPGTSATDVYSAASDVLEQRGFGPLAHHAGHGLGLEHPEPPILVPESSDVLREGDVITLEPGCYVPGVGGMRFEHNYRITDSAAERLNHHALGL